MMTPTHGTRGKHRRFERQDQRHSNTAVRTRSAHKSAVILVLALDTPSPPALPVAGARSDDADVVSARAAAARHGKPIRLATGT